MDDTLTTANGPLHDTNTADTTVDDRAIVAYYASEPEATAARDSLVAAGVPMSRIVLQTDAENDPALAAQIQPADTSIVAKIRQVIAPEETARLPQQAIREGQTVLTVMPEREEAEQVVAILEASNPRHFDARLERWRNSV